MEIEYCYTTPLWPRANDEEERQKKSLLKSMGAARTEEKNSVERGAKQVPFGVQVYATFNYRKESCRVTLSWRLTTKIPELVNFKQEEVEARKQAVRDRGTQRKQFDRNYGSIRDRNMREGDCSAWEKESK